MGVARAVAETSVRPLTQTKAVSKSRISSIDVMRGLVVVLMLVDQAEDEAGLGPLHLMLDAIESRGLERRFAFVSQALG